MPPRMLLTPTSRISRLPLLCVFAGGDQELFHQRVGGAIHPDPISRRRYRVAAGRMSEGERAREVEEPGGVGMQRCWSCWRIFTRCSIMYFAEFLGFAVVKGKAHMGLGGGCEM